MIGQGAKIDIWGVGTKLITGYDQPALGGVYKLTAIKNKNEEWEDKVKLSEQSIKVTNPGIQQVRRYSTDKENTADVIYTEGTDLSKGCTMIDPSDITRQKKISPELKHEDMLVPIFRKGKKVYNSPRIDEIRQKTFSNLSMFHGGIKRFVHPHQYPVGLEKSLFDLKTKLILKHKNI